MLQLVAKLKAKMALLLIFMLVTVKVVLLTEIKLP